MAWYDSQLLGVVVGGIIGGFGKIYFDSRSANHLKMSLVRGIKSEVKILKEPVHYTHWQLSGYVQALRASGQPRTKFRSLGEFRLSFTEANLEKIGILDYKFLAPLIEIKALLDRLSNAMRLLYETNDAVVDGRGQRDLLVEQLDIVVPTLKRLEEACEKVITYESSTSTLVQVIAQLINILEKIVNFLKIRIMSLLKNHIIRKDKHGR